MTIVFVLNIAGIAIQAEGSVTQALPAYQPMDIGPKLRDSDYQVDIHLDPMPASESSVEEAGTDSLTILDEKLMLWYDDISGLWLDWYYLVAEGEFTEIWVQIDMSYPAGDPRPAPVVTQEQVDYLLNEFESNIYSTDTDYFGTPNFHDGSNAPLAAMLGLPEDYYYSPEGKKMIMVSNIGDEMYYDPDYPYFIIGFYWGTYEYYFNRNIINIDGDFWEAYTGLEGDTVYEGTIAHEYQHLIHDDYNPDDGNMMNEGCSTFAEWLCGYGVPWGDINSYLATPDNSLTAWSDHGGINILADYGQAFLWAMYLNDHFGPEFLGQFVQAGIPGVEGLNTLMAPYTFDQVFHDWRIANLIHSDYPGCGRYNYKSIDLGSADADSIRVYEVEGVPVPWTAGTDFGTTITILDYDTEVSMIASYGSDYIEFTKWKRKYWSKFLFFDGDDEAIFGWQLTDTGEWYTGPFEWDADNLANTLLFGEAYVDPTDPYLRISTDWLIEDHWDYGFIQVSTDSGETWNSLTNEYTTAVDPGTHPDIIANLYGLTGVSGGYVDMSFDLTAYVGQTVLIGFRYMTDWYTTWPGWYISDASVSGTELDLDVIYPEAEFMVSVVYKYKCRGNYYYYVKDMHLCDESNFGIKFVPVSKPASIILVVSPIMPNGFTDYSFKVPLWNWCD